MRSAACSVPRTTSMGSLLGTIVVRKAMRWSGRGGTGTGSREITEASDSEKTLISRRSSMRPIEPMTIQFA